MTSPTTPEGAEVRHHPALTAFLAQVPLLRPVDADSTSERRLWRACELCTYLGYRLGPCPDPCTLSDEAIADWCRRGLARGEVLSDPAEMDWYQPYWVVLGGRPIGTVALMVQDPGWGAPNLWVASLYIFPESRRSGWGTLIMAVLEGVVRCLGLGGIRLDTEWVWQGAVRFYLRQGYWVANWKRGLSLVRYCQDPAYRVWSESNLMMFAICPGHRRIDEDAGLEGTREAPRVLISARRRGETLIWQEHLPTGGAGESDQGPRASPASTFALWLAVSGWPLIRGSGSWGERYRWSDAGMPEGLAYKIAIFEAYARHLGFAVDTPRIPGLVYPDWQDLQAPD
jgi:GNAT superfamily N-acetyltransferase